VHVLAKAARAVGAAHRAAVIHRDLKPGNILVDAATLETTVVDFGLAFSARLEAPRLSQTGEIVGSPVSMAPETVAGTARPDDPRLDVYALVLILYVQLAGSNPFQAKTAAEAWQRIARGVPPLRRGVDPALA